MCGMVTCILILTGSLSCLKEAKRLDMISKKKVSVNFKINFLIFGSIVVGTHWNRLIEAIPMCTYTMSFQ